MSPASPILASTLQLSDRPRFGEYLLERLIDGYGAVQSFEAADPAGNRRMIRGVRSATIEDASAIGAFQADVAAIRAVPCERIDTPLDVGLEPVPYLVTELREGAILGRALAALEGEAMPPDAAILLGRDLADALRAAHAASVVHGAMGPESVFVDASGQTRLGDFGLASLCRRLGSSAPSSPASLLRYLPPEPSPSTASDMWGLGAILYEAASGKPAFDADQISVLRMKIASGVVASLPRSVPAPFAELISSMLQVDPVTRPDAPSVFDALDRMVDDIDFQKASAYLGDLPIKSAAPERKRTMQDGLDLASLGMASADASGLRVNDPTTAPKVALPALPALPPAKYDDEPTVRNDSFAPPEIADHPPPFPAPDDATAPLPTDYAAPLPPPPRKVSLPSVRPSANMPQAAPRPPARSGRRCAF